MHLPEVRGVGLYFSPDVANAVTRCLLERRRKFGTIGAMFRESRDFQLFISSCAEKSSSSAEVPTDSAVASPDASDTGDTAENALLASPGVQLYTVRDAMAADFEGTLRTLFDLGYRQVEFAGYFERSPGEVKQLLASLNLSSPSAHFSVDEFRDPETMLNTAVVAGHQTAVMAWLPDAMRTEAGYAEAAGLLNAAAVLALPLGIQVAYHNHDFEFAPLGDTTGFDRLMQEADPSVEVELDIYWSTLAGIDLETLLFAYPGRFALCHLKDMNANKEMQDVGSGILDWQTIIPELTEAGCTQFYVEHDNPADGLASVQNSYRFLTTPR